MKKTNRELFYVMKDPNKYIRQKYLLNGSHLFFSKTILQPAVRRGCVNWKDNTKQSKTERPFSLSNKKKKQVSPFLSTLGTSACVLFGDSLQHVIVQNSKLRGCHFHHKHIILLEENRKPGCSTVQQFSCVLVSNLTNPQWLTKL